MTTDNGSLISGIKYMPYGSTRSGDVPTDRKFTGQRYDDTGLYYYGARYYDPEIGRFISADTMAPDPYNPQSRNKYSYCFNNPLRYVDPSGKWPKFLDEAVSWVKQKVEVVVEAATEFVSQNIDTIQTMLDVAGMIPVVGEAFDAVNGAIYAARGDAANAALSFAACIPVLGNVGTGVKLAGKVVDKVHDAMKVVDKVDDVGTEIVQRVMKKSELELTQSTGLLRGGKDGIHHVTPAASSDALRARQRLALPYTPEVRVTMEVPSGVFSNPSRVQPKFGMPGGGLERIATGNIPINILEILYYYSR